MKSIAIFNNKGGVGKSTLTFHTAYALAEMGHRTLLLDLDPQSNLTLFGISSEDLNKLWEKENDYIDDFSKAKGNSSIADFKGMYQNPRSIHFLLKPTEDGTGETQEQPHPLRVTENLDLIPGRLTLHTYEDKIANRWPQAYIGDPLAIRTITRIRRLCSELSTKYDYKYVLVDTSPSLGMLNKVIISTADGFLIPCMPDMFSLYGIRNIGKSLENWKKEFKTMFELLSDSKRTDLPENFVQFLGYTIYNARKYNGLNRLDIAKAHYNFAEQIPDIIKDNIPPDSYVHLQNELMIKEIGGTAVLHTHNTLPSMAQKYRAPMWKIPFLDLLEPDDRKTIIPSKSIYEATKLGYHEFARQLIERIDTLG